MSPTPSPTLQPTGSGSTWLDIIQGVSGVATVIGGLLAFGLAWIAIRQLRSQADSAKLTAVLETNKLWNDVRTTAAKPVTLHAATINAIKGAYQGLVRPGESVLGIDLQHSPDFTLPIPFVLGALLPVGNSDKASTTETATDYRQRLMARSIAFGYVLNHLRLLGGSDQTIADDVHALVNAAEAWVNRMNEIDELYEAGLIDRSLFIGKRHITLVQQSFFIEPYIIWRNTQRPGRWGQRILSMGDEVRQFHWNSYLHDSAVSARVDPPGHEGFIERVGWMIGPGLIGDSPRNIKHTRRFQKEHLGDGFGTVAKVSQKRLISEMPLSTTSGFDVPLSQTWEALIRDSTRVAESVELLR